MDIESLLASFPLSKDQEEKREIVASSPYYKMSLLIKMMDVLKKEPKSIEEAAMLFNRAKPLAEMFLSSSQKTR
jgi:hypothetical protein